MTWSKAVPVVLGLLLVSLAGCTATDEPPTPGDGDEKLRDLHADHDTTEHLILTGAKAPQWAVGDHWLYTLSDGSTFSMIVTRDNGASWEMGTADPEAAWIHIREEISYLGKVSKDDLSGSQGSDRVRYFDFPLTEDKTWTTKWDGVDRQITVVSAGETFYLEAYEADELAVSYTYDPRVGWFTDTNFYFGGEAVFGFTLSDHGTNYTGEVVYWDAIKFTGNTGGGAMDAYHDSHDVADGTGELWVWFSTTCDGIVAHFDLQFVPQGADPSEGISVIGDCGPIEDTFIVEDPTPGPWIVRWYTAGPYPEDPTSRGAIQYELEIWARTLVSETIG